MTLKGEIQTNLVKYKVLKIILGLQSGKKATTLNHVKLVKEMLPEL